MAAPRPWYARIGIAGLIAAAFVCGRGADAAPAPGSYEIVLDEMNRSGERAVVDLKPVGNKTLVTIKATGAPADPQPAHFHSGSCDKYNARPLHMLALVVNGGSTTTLDVPIDQLVKGDLVINVHRSLTDIATIASCGVAK